MLTVVCPKCKNTQTLPFYIYDVRIIVEEVPFAETDSNKNYTASVLGRATCPTCGEDIREHFMNTIYRTDIVDLATRRYTR